jgi:serine/threonine protein kinase
MLRERRLQSVSMQEPRASEDSARPLRQASGLRRRYARVPGARTAQLTTWDGERGTSALPAHSRDSALPEAIGSYHVQQKLGSGGMAETFVATRRQGPRVGERYCIKRLLPVYAQRHEVMSQFVTEARVLSALRHPNIVRAVEFGAAEGGSYLVLELVQGVDLGQLLLHLASRGQRLSPAACIHIVSELCRALAHAHALELDGEHAGLVHRDVSPSNVLLSEQGEVKLADFGIARIHARTTHTQPGHAKGKSGYMAPEQITCREVDARTDLFALGVLLFQMLFGFVPFDGDSDYDVMRRIVTDERAPFPADAQRLPPALLSLLEQLLANDPEARPASASAVLRVLEALPVPADRACAIAQQVAEARADLNMLAADHPTVLCHGEARRIGRTHTST